MQLLIDLQQLTRFQLTQTVAVPLHQLNLLYVVVKISTLNIALTCYVFAVQAG